MPLLALLSALRICLAYTNYHRLIREIKEEMLKGVTGQTGKSVGSGLLEERGDSVCYLGIEISRLASPFSPSSSTPSIQL